MNSKDNKTNHVVEEVSATLPGFESALLAQTSWGNNIYDLDKIINKMIQDSTEDDKVLVERTEEYEEAYESALDQFWYDLSYYKTPAEQNTFIILDGPVVAWPQFDEDELPF